MELKRFKPLRLPPQRAHLVPIITGPIAMI